MEKLEITAFNKGHLTLDWEITCSAEQVIKLGLLGYLTVKSELRLRHYLIIKELKFLGCLADYEIENCWLRYQSQAKEVELKIPVGVVDLSHCFRGSDIERLKLSGEGVESLYGLAVGCKLLRRIFIDVNFSNEIINLEGCFWGALCLMSITFSNAVNRATIASLFAQTAVEKICLRNYVLNVEDDAFECFYNCKELVIIDCSGVKFNKGVKQIVVGNPKLETISFRDCWFGDRVNLPQYYFTHPVTIDLRGARCKGLEGVKSLSTERESNKEVDEFIKQFELEKVTLILD